MNSFKVCGKVLDKTNSVTSSITGYSSVVSIDLEVSSIDFGEKFSDLSEIELPKVITFEFFRHKHFHFDHDLRKSELIQVEDKSQRSRDLEKQVQLWTTGLRVDDPIEFEATHINNLGIVDMQPHMFYKNLTHYQPYVILSDYQEGRGIPKIIENNNKNEEMDLTNEPVGKKPSWIKRIIPFLNRLFIEIIWNSCVSACKWLLSKINPS